MPELSVPTMLLLGIILAWAAFRLTVACLLGYASVMMCSVKHPTLPIGKVPLREKLVRFARISRIPRCLFLFRLLERGEQTMRKKDDSLMELVYYLYGKGFLSPAVAVTYAFAAILNPLLGYLGALVVLTFLIYGTVWWSSAFFVGPNRKERRRDLADSLVLYAYIAWVTPGYYGRKTFDLCRQHPLSALALVMLVLGCLTWGIWQTVVAVIVIAGLWAVAILARVVVAGFGRAVFVAPGYLRPLYRFGLVPLGKALQYLGGLLFGADTKVQGIKDASSMNLMGPSAMCVGCPNAIVYQEAIFPGSCPESGFEFGVGMPIYLPCLTPCREWKARYEVEESVPFAQTA